MKWPAIARFHSRSFFVLGVEEEKIETIKASNIASIEANEANEANKASAYTDDAGQAEPKACTPPAVAR